MKYIKFYLFGSLLTFVFYSCTQQAISESVPIDIEHTEVEDAIQDVHLFESDTTYSFEILKPSADTFKLLSHNWYFWWPYGKFTTPEELKSHYTDRFSIEEEISLSNSSPTGHVTLYRLKMNNGFVKFLHTTWDEESGNNDMAIVSAKITDPTLEMTNGLKVGLTRDEVKEILFSKGEPTNIRDYKNVQIETVLTGVWVHLNFESDRLKRIVIDTDYQLNKE
ncbi:hypothetical protein [Pontibacter cellulosilyticus]|uniref:Lipoprotein n=1 Tax=Pontibacter cellulosilyticus TaxID=1720253 RepID=A0A923NBF1_9BACT|nr:hypothetical protein [Pontibacter cellulosilyticus]MBC5994337.1 hypothetical protein [Pontibacter cellulosilyticus]